MQAVRTPTKRNQSSVYNMIKDSQSQVSSESEWIRQREDLAALGHGAEHGWFNGVVENILNKVATRLSLVSNATRNINDHKTAVLLQAVRSDDLVLPALATLTLQPPKLSRSLGVKASAHSLKELSVIIQDNI